MKKEHIDKCISLFERCYSSETKTEKEVFRNQLYSILQQQMKIWISNILAKNEIYPSNEELLSLSWECFMFCFERFDFEKEVPIPNHFYSYTKFFLMPYSPHNKDYIFRFNGDGDDIHNIITTDHKDLDIYYSHLDEIKSFRSILNNDYKMVFDDAFMSMAPSNTDRKDRMKECPLPHLRYRESKRIFKLIIDFLLRR